MINCRKSTVCVLLILAALSALAIRSSNGFIVKRSFIRLGCMGQYDKSNFATLDRICEECYNLYREPGLHTSCRANCFKNAYFDGCVQALLLRDKEQEISAMVDKLYGGSSSGSK